MKRKENKGNLKPAKRHFKRFVVFLLCFELLGSDMPLVYAKASSGHAEDKGCAAESASDADRPGEGCGSTDNAGVGDDGPDFEEEGKDEVADKTENEPEERGNEENAEEFDSRILQRTVSAMIFEDASYDRLLADGTTITLTGEMPEGAVVRAYPAEAEIQGILILAAYDITVFDEDGNIWQPENDSIDVTIDNKDIRDAFANDRNIAVFHIDEDDGAEVEEIPLLSLNSRKARFCARHFSIYIVGDTGLSDIEGQSVTEYVFEFYEDGNIICSQAVTAGEYLSEPAYKEIPCHVFNGWFNRPDGNGERFDFSETAEENLKRWGYDTDEKDTITTALYAYYTPAFYVYFMTLESEDPSVFYTVEYHENEPRLETGTATGIYQDLYLTTDEGELYYAVTGWYFYDKNGKKEMITEGSIIDHDTVLYPEVQSSVWIYFNMGGAETDTVDVPAPVYVLPGDKTVGEKFPADPERPGYKFEGWFTENKDKVTADTDIDSIERTKGSILLYAVWKETAAGYTVNIWRQKTESSISAKEYGFTDYSDEYDIAETIYVTADSDAALTTGSPLKNIFELEEWGEWTGYAADPAQDSHYLGFEYNENRTVSQPGLDSALTAGDGSTVINIYYDRVTITWNFYGIRYASRPSDTSTLKPVCRLQGLWGADLKSGEWPSAEKYIDGCIWCYEGISYRFDTSYKYLYLLNSAVPMTDVDFYLKDVQNGGKLYVYKEVLARNAKNIPEPVTLVVDGVTKYYEYFTEGILIANNQYGISEKFNTHHASGYINTKGTTGTGNFVKVSTNNGLETPMIKVDDDHEQIIVLFYDLNSYDLTFYSNGEKLSERSYLYSEPIRIPGEEEILAAVSDNPHIRPAAHYVFAGWGASSSSTEPSPVYKTMPGKDLVYYAVWKCKEISITYDPGALNGTVTGMPQDEVTFAASRASRPKDPARAGYIFLGWKTGDGQMFNFNAVLYDNTKLTAVWKPLDPSGHGLTYVVCGPESERYFYYSVPVTFYEDAKERVLTIEEVFDNAEDIEFTPEEKEKASGKFICWNSSIDGTGDNYYPDSKYTFGDSNGIVYSRFAAEKKAILHLKYNYPEGNPAEPEKRYEDLDLTTENLAEIDLADISGLNREDMITADGEEYGFAGWSRNEYASSEEEAEISPDAKISVNGSENTLYAVWVKSGTEEKAAFDAEILVPAEQVPAGSVSAGSTGGGHRGSAGQNNKIPAEEENEAEEEYKSSKDRPAEQVLTDVPEEELPYTGDPGREADTYSVLPICLFISVICLFIFLQIFRLAGCYFVSFSRSLKKSG